MGAVSWPALSESTRSGSKQLVTSEQTFLQLPEVSQTQLKPAKTNPNNCATTKKHNGRQQTMKRGSSAGVRYAGHNRPLPPPPLPLPPPFPIFDMSYYNYIPLMLDSFVRPRPKGGSDRRNNFGFRPRADVAFNNNGYGGGGPRGPASRDVCVPQIAPPPPPGWYFRLPHMGPTPTSFIVVPPIRPYGTHMGYDALLVYDSDTNLIKDNFLRSNMDDEGWVPISMIAGFNRVQNFTTNMQMILIALRYSSAVEIQDDKVRRRNDWGKWVKLGDVLRGETNDSVEETLIRNLTLEELQ